MQAFLLGYGAKLLLPLILPLLTTGIKLVIDKFTPIALDKIPKPLWAGVVTALAHVATTIAPDMFLFPGLPPEASTLLYAVAAMGTREIADQAIKVVNQGEGKTPAGM
jgi:hypothetical protein